MFGTDKIYRRFLILQVRRKWSEILEVLKEKKSRILVKVSFKSEGE